MKKLDLIKSAKKGFPNAERMLNEILKAINTALVKGESVTIYNFGKFYVTKSNVRKVYDFKTKRTVAHKGRYKIKFKPAPSIEQMLNENKEKENTC